MNLNKKGWLKEYLSIKEVKRTDTKVVVDHLEGQRAGPVRREAFREGLWAQVPRHSGATARRRGL